MFTSVYSTSSDGERELGQVCSTCDYALGRALRPEALGLTLLLCIHVQRWICPPPSLYGERKGIGQHRAVHAAHAENK